MTYRYDLAPVRAAFESYVDTEIPNVTGAFRVCADYTEHRNNWTLYPEVRAYTSVINWKSNVGGADSVRNFRVKLSEDIHRGDLVYDPESGTIGLLTYYIDSVVDCKKTQITSCNLITTVKRNIPDVLNSETGVVVTAAHQDIIAASIPCFYSSMYGRFTYEIGNNTPGIIPDQKMEVKMQWNSETSAILPGDELLVHGMKHRIMFGNYEYIDISGDHGFVIFTCERA